MSHVHSASRRRRILSVLFFLAALLLAVELGLRANEHIQVPPSPLTQSPTDQFNIVSFGDSVSATFPIVLEGLLNENDRDLPVKVFNLFRTAPNRGLFQKNIENGIARYHPQAALVMLDTLDFRTSRKPITKETLPTSIWAKHSLIARLIYMKLAPLFDRPARSAAPLATSSDVENQLGGGDVDPAAFVDDLLNHTCCVETGALKAEALRLQTQRINWPNTEQDRRKVADFLTLLLTHQYAQAEAVLDALPTTISKLGIQKLDLAFALDVEKGLYDKAIAAIRNNKERVPLSEFLCAAAINASRSEENVEIEKHFIDACLTQNPMSAKINFYEIDFYVRRNDHGAILNFLPKIDRLKKTQSIIALSRIYYSAGVHFFHRDEFSLAKQYFEEALRLNPRLQRAINYYTTALRRLKRTHLPAKIPDDIKVILEKNDRITRTEQNDGALSLSLKDSAEPQADTRADYPPGYIDALNRLCERGIYTVMLNYPQQDIAPMKRGLEAVSCLHYVDLHALIDAELKSGRHTFSEIFQHDGFHFTALGDELIATAICRDLKENLKPWFASVSCAKP